MKNVTPLVLLALATGVLLGTSIRPAQADGADELRRSRVALESIAHSLEKCR